MTVIVLVLKKRGKYAGNSVYHDKAIEDAALVVDNEFYTDAKDRLYDVKGLEEIWAQFTNNGANAIKMLIEKTHKEFTDLANLTSLDFEEVTEATIAVAVAATGTVTLDTGASGSVDSIKVDGLEILSASVPFNTSLGQTALDVASNINAFTTDPGYTANAAGAVITLTAKKKKPFTGVVLSAATTITTTDVNFSGGDTGKSVAFTKTQLTPEITALKFKFKESVGGSAGDASGEMGLT